MIQCTYMGVTRPSTTELDACIFVLGARDPEMDRIEQIIHSYDIPFVYALDDLGNRVNPRNAYDTRRPIELGSLTPVFVECEPSLVDSPFIPIDHHRPGDPGYHKHPAEFAEAASIGQLCMVLGIEMSHDDKILAAMDHCFGSAVNGQCPGVSKQDVLELKIDTIASSHRVSRQEVTEQIQASMSVIYEAPETEIGPIISKDLRNLSLGMGNSLEHLVVVTAQAILGVPLLLTEDDYSGVKKTTFRSPNPTDIAYVMTMWQDNNNYIDVYGVPNRGYAGAYRVTS